ncbi:hypothetical protein ACFXKR_35090 [Streptomyces violascens]|uniref:hypothetical protein n=1 Tax=Streptomyces violascens TaxID=67381 RepID=UPI003679511F
MPTGPEAWTDVLRGASFPVVGRTGHGLLLGRNTWHLGFRASILVADGLVTLGTVERFPTGMIGSTSPSYAASAPSGPA